MTDDPVVADYHSIGPPEAEVAEFAGKIGLGANGVDYLISLLQQARILGSEAGTEAERRRCQEIILSAARRLRDRSRVHAIDEHVALVLEDLAKKMGDPKSG